MCMCVRACVCVGAMSTSVVVFHYDFKWKKQFLIQPKWVRVDGLQRRAFVNILSVAPAAMKGRRGAISFKCFKIFEKSVILRSRLNEKTIDALIFLRKNLKSEWSVLWSSTKKNLGCYKIITLFIAKHFMPYCFEYDKKIIFFPFHFGFF